MGIVNALRSGLRISDLLDWFIPAEMQVHAETHRRARMFMLSHAFGPILGNTIPLYMAITGISRDYHVVVFFLSILTFWIYPFALRQTGRYQLIAFISVQNLIFCVLWACWSYGGTASPFLPWFLIFPLLAFLYLPPKGMVRNVLLTQIYGSVALFIALVFSGLPLPYVDLAQLQVIGMISMASVAIYFAMMSLYFAKMFHEQREFTREINALVSTSDNIRNLTMAAYQASAAKSDFVAGMSHELRTPLNAIIGYSQLLLEEARDEQDEETFADLGRVHKAGSDLLRLIDDILSYSRIEAGKMPLNPTYDCAANHRDEWLGDKIEAATVSGYRIEVNLGKAAHVRLYTDWAALGAAIRHLIAGIACRGRQGRLLISMQGEVGELSFRFVDESPTGEARPIDIIREMFEHSDDASPTKYGGTGIDIALAFKFTQLVRGEIGPATGPDGRPAIALVVRDLTRSSRELAA